MLQRDTIDTISNRFLRQVGFVISLKTTLAAAALLATTSPAFAVTITTTFAANNAATNIPVFQTFGVNVPDGTPFVPNQLIPASMAPGYLSNSGSPVESVSPGSTVNYYSSATVPGQAVGPVPLVGSYISILSGSYSVAFSGVQVLSFVYAALDDYNSVTLNFASSATRTFTGAQIATGSLATAINDANFMAGSGRVTYDFGGTDTLTSVIFSTTSPAFEIDELASAVPEPATWALMILGFGIVGSALRRRRQTKVRFNFA